MAAEGGDWIRRLGVLGAGTMGAGIAQVAATAGIEVLLHDPLPGAVSKAVDRIAAFLARRVEKEELSPSDRDAAITRLWPQPRRGPGHRRAGGGGDLRGPGAEAPGLPTAGRRRAAATLLATNTSSLSVARIASAAAQPARVLGMHFFNPVPLMALVEVILGPMTDGAVERVQAVACQLGKEPVVAADTPGFIVNRVARPFYLEAMRIVGEGAAGVSEVDGAMRGIGFRMGPFELVDAIGLDVNFAVSQSVYEQAFFEPRYRPHPCSARWSTQGAWAARPGALLRLRCRWRAREVWPAWNAVRMVRGSTTWARSRSPRGCWPPSSTRLLGGRRRGGDAQRRSTRRCAWAPTTRPGHSSGRADRPDHVLHTLDA